jgi:ABC-2 type transport system permease protein
MPELAATLSDTSTMVVRGVRLSMRNVDGLISSIALPVMLMIVFVYLFGGAIQTGTEYVNYVVPGVIVLCAAFGAATTAVSVSSDMTSGIMDRFRSMSITPGSVLVGHVVASLARNMLAAGLVIGVALIIGFRPSAGPAEWLSVAGLLVLFITSMSWFAATVGLFARSPEAASGASFFAMFLPYLSSAFVPIETMPSWLRPVAEHQPVTPLIEAVRALLVGGDVGSSAAVAVAWWAGIGLLFAVLATRQFAARRTG